MVLPEKLLQPFAEWRQGMRPVRRGVNFGAHRKRVRQPAYSPVPLTRLSHYNGDKLSRLAPPSKLIKCQSPCGIRSLAEGRTLGAHFAGRLAFDLPSKRHRIELFPHSSRGRRVKEENTRRPRYLDALRLYFLCVVPPSMEVLWMNTDVL